MENPIEMDELGGFTCRCKYPSDAFLNALQDKTMDATWTQKGDSLGQKNGQGLAAQKTFQLIVTVCFFLVGLHLKNLEQWAQRGKLQGTKGIKLSTS